MYDEKSFSRRILYEIIIVENEQKFRLCNYTPGIILSTQKRFDKIKAL